MSNYPGVSDVLTLYEEDCVKPFKRQYNSNITYELYPFITVEGVQGSGHTAVSKILSQRLGGIHLSYPIKCLAPMSPFFERHKLSLRRAYSALCNYAVSFQAKFYQQLTPVVTDRYYATSFSQTVSAEFIKNKVLMPPEGDLIYSLPADLKKPTISFYLNVSDSTRLNRMRNVVKYKIASRNLVKENYFLLSRLRDPELIPVDGETWYDATAEKIYTILRERNIVPGDTAVDNDLRSP